jgi:hypothetical protein
MRSRFATASAMSLASSIAKRRWAMSRQSTKFGEHPPLGELKLPSRATPGASVPTSQESLPLQESGGIGAAHGQDAKGSRSQMTAASRAAASDGGDSAGAWVELRHYFKDTQGDTFEPESVRFGPHSPGSIQHDQASISMLKSNVSSP